MRPIWSGAISFGLILIPVKLYPALREERPDLHMLRRGDLCPIGYARVCRQTGEEVPYEEIVKGYEYRKGDYVVLEDEDFKRAGEKRTQTIEVMEFVSESEIDGIYLEKPYYLEPTKEARKAYALLREALRRTGKVGIARFVLRNREHLALLKPGKDVIVLNQMRFQSEIRPPSGLDLPPSESATARELDMAINLIDQLTEPFSPEKHHDTYAEELRRITDAKIRGKLPAAKPAAVSKEVPDLMARLRESLKKAKEKGAVPA